VGILKDGWMGFSSALDHVTALFVHGSRLSFCVGTDAAEEHVILLTIIVASPQLSWGLISG